METIKNSKANSVKLYPIFNPSKHVSDELIFNIYKIIISYGGGMGGVNEILYVKNITYKDKGYDTFKNFWLVELYTGEKRYLNKEFVVSVEFCNLVKIVTDVTEHKYCNKERHGKLYSFAYYEIPVDQNYIFIEDTNKDNPIRIDSFFMVME